MMADQDVRRGVRPPCDETASAPTGVGNVVPLPDHSTVARVARFMLNVMDGDHERALRYARRFEVTSDDKAFARAVRLWIVRTRKRASV